MYTLLANAKIAFEMKQPYTPYASAGIDTGYWYSGTTSADLSPAPYDCTAKFSSHSFMVGLQHQL